MKTIIAVVLGLIIIGGGVFFFVQKNDTSDTTASSSASSDTSSVKKSTTFVAVDACDVLTDAVAKQVLGDMATKSDTSAGNVSSDDLSVSNCAYTYRTNTTGSGLEQANSAHTVGVLARAAKSETGATSNQAQFSTAKQAGVEDVSGYGDAAYWNPKFSQLNILKGNNWYIVSYYDGLKTTDGTLDQAKQLADALKNNLK